MPTGITENMSTNTNTKVTELIPPDLKQCQSLVPNGYTFMTLGGKPGHVRCENAPTVIVYETVPAEDGLMGSMSCCAQCLEKLKEQRGLAGLRLAVIQD